MMIVPADPEHPTPNTLHPTPQRTLIRLGLVGVGRFCRRTHLELVNDLLYALRLFRDALSLGLCLRGIYGATQSHFVIHDIDVDLILPPFARKPYLDEPARRRETVAATR